MDPDQVRALLPWRQPFQMIDQLIECVPHERIATLKLVTVNDTMGEARALAGGVASGRGPVLPPAMILEGMSQSAALLFQISYGALAKESIPMLGDMKATYHDVAHPGEAIVFAVRAVKMTSTAGLFEGAARVGERLIAQAGFAMSVSRRPDGTE